MSEDPEASLRVASATDFTLEPDEPDLDRQEPPRTDAGDTPNPSPTLAGCMECKAQRPYTVKAWPNGNTTWHCTVCGKVLRLVPGQYSTHERS